MTCVHYCKGNRNAVLSAGPETCRGLQERLGFPSDIDLANAIDYNIVGNCQLNQRDIQIANNIFGPSIAAIKGKSTRR